MWECQWKKIKASLLKNGIEINTGLAAVPRLDPRKDLFGGRCEIFQMYAEMRDGERGVMLDVISLYPSVMLFERFPTGHPEVIIHSFDYVNFATAYFGQALVTVIPPRNLKVPVLPWRMPNGGIAWTLCRSCSLEVNISTPCTHTDDERSLTCSWITPLINRAVELGYRIQKIYEIHHYPQSMQYNPETGEEGLFSKFIIKALWGKTMSSGYPSHVTTDEQKRAFCEEHLRRMGMFLDWLAIRLNAGKRCACKLVCNCCWGSELIS